MIASWRGAAVVAALAAAGVVYGELDPRPRPTDPALDQQVRADVTALLDGLAPGARVAGWTVLGIRVETDRVRIDLARDKQRFAVLVASLGARAENPPVRTDFYAIYYGHAHPPDTRIPDGAVRAITHDIARRIRRTEKRVAEPAGL